MSNSNNQPDWHAIAEKFDLWLPQIKPVGDELIKRLNAQQGDHILDLASGTGEPALTLARTMGDSVKIVGVDSAQGMIDVAQAKVETEGLGNIKFQAMPAEKMSFDDNQFDKALCRFGVMLFENPQQGVNEIYRVLKPGGDFALAVWGEAETMPVMYWSYEVFKDKVPKESHPPLEKITSMGAPGAIDTIMANAGFSEIKVERHTFHYQFDTFDEYWDVVEASDIMKLQFDALKESDRAVVRNEVAGFAKEYIGESGLRVPHDFLLAYGKK